MQETTASVNVRDPGRLLGEPQIHFRKTYTKVESPGLVLSALEKRTWASQPGWRPEERALKTLAAFAGVVDIVHRAGGMKTPRVCCAVWTDGGRIALSTSMTRDSAKRKEGVRKALKEDLRRFFPFLEKAPTPLMTNGRTRENCAEPSAWIQ
jgi:hypothetical protein